MTQKNAKKKRPKKRQKINPPIFKIWIQKQKHLKNALKKGTEKNAQKNAMKKTPISEKHQKNAQIENANFQIHQKKTP